MHFSFFMLKDLSAKRSAPVLITNRENFFLIEEAWPQTVCLFKSVNQSSITLLGLFCLLKDSFITFMLKDLSAQPSIHIARQIAFSRQIAR